LRAFGLLFFLFGSDGGPHGSEFVLEIGEFLRDIIDIGDVLLDLEMSD
jgi:hypothetical protein